MNLDAALRSLEPAWPETPDIAAAVVPRLGPKPARPRRRPLLAVAFATLALSGTAVAAIPSLREWVDELFGGRVEVREVPSLPPAEPGPDLGARLSLPDARARAGIAAPWPRALAGAHFHAVEGEFRAAGGGILFTAIRGDVPFEFVEKLLGPGTSATEVRVGDGRGIWISGKPHAFLLRRAGAVIEEEPLRLAGNTLLWPRGDLVLRIEGARTLPAALRLAESVR